MKGQQAITIALALGFLTAYSAAARSVDAPDRTRRPLVGVAEFRTVGEIGVSDAGAALAELLVAQLDPGRYQLVERSNLSAILNEHDLTIAEVVHNPAVLRGSKLKGVRYLILGSVVKLGDLFVSVRMVDATTGRIVRTAETTARNVRGLRGSLTRLAAALNVTLAQQAARVCSARELVSRRRRALQVLQQMAAAAD